MAFVGWAGTPIEIIWNNSIHYNPLEPDEALFAQLIRDTYHIRDQVCSAAILKEVEETLKKPIVQRLAKEITEALSHSNPMESVEVHICANEDAIVVKTPISAYGTSLTDQKHFTSSGINNFLISALRKINRFINHDLSQRTPHVRTFYRSLENDTFFTISSKSDIFSFQSCQITQKNGQYYLESPLEVLKISAPKNHLYKHIRLKTFIEVGNTIQKGSRVTKTLSFQTWPELFEQLEFSNYCQQIKVIESISDELSIAQSFIHQCNNKTQRFILIKKGVYENSPRNYSCLGIEDLKLKNSL